MHLADMKRWLFACGYPEKIFEKQLKQLVFGNTEKHGKTLLNEYL